jgi:hypothetical protein
VADSTEVKKRLQVQLDALKTIEALAGGIEMRRIQHERHQADDQADLLAQIRLAYEQGAAVHHIEQARAAGAELAKRLEERRARRQGEAT